MCVFGFKRRQNYSFGVDPEFMDYVWEREGEVLAAEAEKYPSCWDKFLHWLGVK